MTLVAAWLVAPALFAALTLGVGLLVEWAGGYRLPGLVLFGLGFTGIVCVSQVITRVAPLAPVTPFAVLLAAVAGFVVARRSGRALRLDRAPAVMVGVVFVAYAAPTVFTGTATFLGYGNEGDAGFHFLLVERLLSHGYDLSDLPYSSYSATVQNYFDTSYPTGSHTALGALQGLVPVDVAWLLEPYLASLVAISALVLYSLVAPLSRTRWLPAVAAGLAMSAGLVYSYANNQQALKELAAIVCVSTAVAVLPALVAARPSWRTGLPLAVVTGGGLGVLSLALGGWIGPLLLVAALVVAIRWRRQPGRVALEMAGFAAVAILFSLPTLTRLGTFVAVANSALTGPAEFGNLLAPLHFIQVFGVWPADDFRLTPAPGLEVAPLLIGAVALAALLGFIGAIRLRAWALVGFAVVSLIGFLVVAGRASPWAYGKALMILSPVALLLAGVAAIGLWEARRRAETLALVLVLVIGVVWTDALNYHSSSAAPVKRLDELKRIAERFDGRGPALYLEFEEFGKYFLRQLDPSGPTEAFRSAPDFRPGVSLQFGVNYDADDFAVASLRKTDRLLVVRRGPAASRPGLGWRLAFRGAFYDVWQRERADPRVVAHLPLGGQLDAGGDAPCADVRSLARQGRRLAYVVRPDAEVFHVAQASLPALWLPQVGSVENLVVKGQGRVTGSVSTGGGRFRVWQAGTLARDAQVRVDGRLIGTVGASRNQLASQYAVGTVDLAAGRHTVEVFVEGGSLKPGDSPIDQVLGQTTFVGDDDLDRVRTLPATDWRSLCGLHLDWVEAVR